MPLAPSPNTRLMSALQSELIAAGIVRSPGVAGPLPPMHLEPSAGAPGPGDLADPMDNDTETVSAFYSGGVVTPPGSNWERQTTIDVWVRTKGPLASQRAMDLEHAIHRQLLPDDEDFVLGTTLGIGPAAMFVDEIRLWRDYQRLGSSKEAGYTFVTAYWFQVRN